MTTEAPFDKKLYRRIGEVAHYIWNPIGVCHTPQTRDEYDAYLPTLYRDVRANDKDALVRYMELVVTERMGMQFDRAKAEAAAEVMLDWGTYLSSARS